MKRNLAVVFAALAISLVGSLCSAVVTVSEHGTWPDSWPKELERYREQAISMQVAHGIQEDVHEIRFREREDFEQAWPYLLKLKTKGAPLILETSPSTDGASGSAAEKGVRILCPSHGASSGPSDGKMLGVGPPWPDDIKLPNGGLPEYVVNHNGKWVPYDGTNRAGFRYRARVDIVLIVDGKIVDLNRIQIPADTPVIDHRFKGKQDAPDAADDKDEARGEGATSRATPPVKREWTGSLQIGPARITVSKGDLAAVAADDDSNRSPEKPAAAESFPILAEGDFALDRDLPVDPSGDAGGKRNVIQPKTIRFEKKDGQIQAVLKGKILGSPKGWWQIEVVLFDAAGALLAEGETEIITIGMTADIATMDDLFRFGAVENVLPLAKRFRLRTVEKDASQLIKASKQSASKSVEPKKTPDASRVQSIRGRLLDYKGQPVEKVRIEDNAHGRTDIHTDKEGRFVIRDAKDVTRITVYALPMDEVAVVAPKQGWNDEEVTIRLPQPATIKVVVDIPGAVQANERRMVKEAGGMRIEPAGQDVAFYLHLFTMPDDANGLRNGRNHVDEYTVGNPGELVIENLLPGFYDFSREETFFLGEQAMSFFCDRQDIHLAAGETRVIRLVRTRGQRVEGEIRGLPEGTRGAFIKVRPAAASCNPDDLDELRLPTLDALTCGGDGKFVTSALEPGQYKIAAKAYWTGPNEGTTRWMGRVPDFAGIAEVTVEEDDPANPQKHAPHVIIEMKPFVRQKPGSADRANQAKDQ